MTRILHHGAQHGGLAVYDRSGLPRAPGSTSACTAQHSSRAAAALQSQGRRMGSAFKAAHFINVLRTPRSFTLNDHTLTTTVQQTPTCTSTTSCCARALQGTRSKPRHASNSKNNALHQRVLGQIGSMRTQLSERRLSNGQASSSTGGWQWEGYRLCLRLLCTSIASQRSLMPCRSSVRRTHSSRALLESWEGPFKSVQAAQAAGACSAGEIASSVGFQGELRCGSEDTTAARDLTHPHCAAFARFRFVAGDSHLVHHCEAARGCELQGVLALSQLGTVVARAACLEALPRAAECRAPHHHRAAALHSNTPHAPHTTTPAGHVRVPPARQHRPGVPLVPPGAPALVLGRGRPRDGV